VQFGFGLRDLNQWDPTGESNGFESDNTGSATSTSTPYTRPVFSNMTLIGPERTDALVGNLPAGNKFQFGALLRRSSQHSVYNSVIAGYPWGLRLRDQYTIQWATQDTLQLRNVSYAASKSPNGAAGTLAHDTATATGWSGVGTWYGTAGYNNTGLAVRNPGTLKFTDLSNLNNPNPVPASGSELIGSADFTNARLSGLEVTTYRGAFDPTKPMTDQWTAGWTNFDPQYANYASYSPVTSVEQVKGAEGLPNAFRLEQNYPNPFNPSTTIRFTLPVKGFVSLKVYTILGQEVAALVSGEMPAGSFETTFDARGMASGTYIYRLVTESFVSTQKMLLLK
jgi:hypothetical protein